MVASSQKRLPFLSVVAVQLSEFPVHLPYFLGHSCDVPVHLAQSPSVRGMMMRVVTVVTTLVTTLAGYQDHYDHPLVDECRSDELGHGMQRRQDRCE